MDPGLRFKRSLRRNTGKFERKPGCRSGRQGNVDGVRNRYIDVLRTVAIVRVIVYHTLGFWWLTVIFPAMGLMFALGGSLMAASIDRSGPAAIGRRLRRILLPVWVLASIAVVSMSFVGGTQ